MSSDSDDGLFITQSKFSQVESFTAEDINSDFENFLDDVPMPDFTLTDKAISDLSSDANDNVNDVEKDGDIWKENITKSDEELAYFSQGFDTKSISLPEITTPVHPPNSIKSRFGKPLSEAELNALEISGRNKNTEKKSQWALRLYETWYFERHGGKFESSPLLKSDDFELNKFMISFITQIKNLKGEEYHGNTLHEILVSLQYYLRQNGRDINFNTDFEFAGLRRILDAKMKKLAEVGIGIRKRKAEVLTCEQEDILWERGILGDDTPQKLLDTVFYLNGICFCLRGGQEHHALKVGDRGNFSFILKNGLKHLKYSEGVTKTNNGGLKHKALEMKSIVVGPNHEKPERCPVRLHEKYLSLRPTSCDAFYLRPLRYPKADIWYCSAPIGRQTLAGFVKRMCSTAGFEGFFTNHSLRATVATRLYENGVDEQLIAERTGHRSTAIRGYKRTSDELLNMVDNLVQRKKGRAASSTVTQPLAAPLTGHTTADLSPDPTESRAEPKPSTVASPRDDVKPIQFTVERNGAKITLTM